MPVSYATSEPATGRVHLQCHGTRISIRSASPHVLRLVLNNLPPDTEIAARSRAHVLYRVVQAPAGTGSEFVVLATGHEQEEGGQIARVSSEESAADALLQDLEFRIALHSPELLFIHAAAVEWLGRAIVIPGTSHSGKSTLTLALLRAGAGYLSDEFTIIDDAGAVLAFPRPLQLREEGGVRRLSPDTVASAGHRPLPLGLVVRTWFERSVTWSPVLQSPGKTALTLLENAVIARTRPQLALSRIGTALSSGAVGLVGPRGDAGEAAQDILAWASREWKAGGIT